MIDQAKAELMDQFKEQLIEAFQTRFEKRNRAVSDHVNKLEADLQVWIPRMHQFRN